MANPLREAAERGMKSVKRDRGDGLYIGVSPDGAPMRYSPDADAMRVYEDWAKKIAPEDELWRLCARQKNAPVTDAERKMWIAGVKYAEAGASEGEIEAYERALRGLAAVCLRAGGGGALAACAACLAIMKLGKEADR